MGNSGWCNYKINKAISVYLGARYVPVVNTYNGSIANIKLGPAGALQNGQTYLTSAAAAAHRKIASNRRCSHKPAKTGSSRCGTFTLAQVQGAGYITADQKAQFRAGLQQLGLTAAQISAMNVILQHKQHLQQHRRHIWPELLQL